jgi:ribokinase
MSNISREITVIGSLNYDRTKYVEKVFQPGESITILSSKDGFGGKGANQALAALRMSRTRRGSLGSVNVSMIGAVGDDDVGQQMKDALQDDGVDVSGVKVLGDTKTGEATIYVERGTGESHVSLEPGANHLLQVQQFSTVENLTGEEGRRPDLLILQMEIPRDVVERILEIAGKEDIPVILNYAPVPLTNILLSSWKNVTHLIANEKEAARLCGRTSDEITRGGYREGWQEVADVILRYGVKYVIITLGPNGLFYSERIGDGKWVGADRVNVVDTTTAGDAFVGAYAAFIVQQGHESLSIGPAIGRALKAAAYVVQRAGTQDTIPWSDDLLDRRYSTDGSPE